MSAFREAAPFSERDPQFGTFEGGAQKSAAEASWALVSLVQKGRVQGATPEDIKRSEYAFAEIYSQHYDSIYASILKRVDYDTDIATELASETFLRAFKGIDALEWQGKNVSSWLRTIAIRLVLDHYRRPSRTTYISEEVMVHWADESELGSPEALVIKDLHTQDQRRAVFEAMQQLSREQQEVITWHYLQGISFPEIARRTGKEASALKSLAWRGVQLLKDRLSNENLGQSGLRLVARLKPDEAPAIASNQEALREVVASYEPIMQADDEPYSDWRAPTTLRDHAWVRPDQAYWRALEHPQLPADQLEEHMAYVALGHDAQSQLSAPGLTDDERDNLKALVQRGIESRQFVATHYMRFALRVALRYSNDPNFEDIIQEANVGLVKGVERYDPYYSLEDEMPHTSIQPFTTIGAHYVNGGILRYLHNERRHRRLHASPRALDRTLLLRSYEEIKRHDPKATYEQVGEGLGLSKAAIRELLLGKVTVRTAVVVDVELDPEKIADPASMEPFEQVETEGMTVDEFWAHVAKNVTEQELRALHEYYVNNKSQEKIAAEMGFASRAWVGELLDRAHARLRKAANGEDPFERKRRGEGKRKNGPRTFFAKLGIPAPEDADPQELRERLGAILDALDLSPTESQIMRLRYGVDTDDGREMSQVETAKQLELSRGYISAIDPKVQMLAKKYLGIEGE